MLKLCSVHYHSPYADPNLIRVALIQIIRSEIGAQDVYNVPSDPCRIEYYGTPSQHFLIQAKATHHIPKILKIINCDKDKVWDYLFYNALYVANTPAKPTLRLLVG